MPRTVPKVRVRPRVRLLSRELRPQRIEALPIRPSCETSILSAMLTDSEVALITTGVGVAGTALGGLIAAWSGRAAARAAARDQRELEAERRRDDRSSDLYRELLVEMDKRERHQQEIVSGLRVPEPDPHEEGEPYDDEEADALSAWRAKVTLFASDDVRNLWEAWNTIFQEGWSPKYSADQRTRLKAARARLEQQMRSELRWKA
jgi:hypothetical protein